MKRQISILACLLMLVAIVFACASCVKPDEQHVHKYTSSVVKAPTCTEKGEERFACKCGDYYSNELPATGHSKDLEEIPYVAPTCTEPGYQSGKKCPDCGAILEAQSIISPIGHKVGASATCTDAQVCENGCGKVFAEALGHDYSKGACYRCDYLPGSGLNYDPYIIYTANNTKYVCDFTEELVEGWYPVYYEYTATESGWLILSAESAMLQLGTTPDAMSVSNQMSYPPATSIKIYAVEGNTYYIGVADVNWEVNKVPFTVSFEAVEPDPFDHLVGSWSGSEQSAWGAGNSYIFTIDENGSGTVSEDYGWGQSTYTITSLIVLGDTVLIDAMDGDYLVSFEFIYDESAPSLSYDKGMSGSLVLTPYDGSGDPVVNESELVIGHNSINATDAKFTFFATQSGKLTLTIGSQVMDGTIEITYCVNGGVVYPVALNSTVEIDLVVGDELVIDVVANAYSTITASWGAGEGGEGGECGEEEDIFASFDSADKVGEDVVYEGYHDTDLDDDKENLSFTASADGILYVTYTGGSYVTFYDASHVEMVSEKDEVNYVYAVKLSEGDVVAINFWQTTPNTESYTYSVYFYEITEECAHDRLAHMEAVTPGCHYEGNIEYWVCYDCEAVWQDEALTQLTNIKNVVVPALGGEVVHVEAAEPTCTALGNIEYWYCEDCEQVWQDEALTQLTNAMNVKIGAKGHTDANADAKCEVCEKFFAPAVGTAFVLKTTQANLNQVLFFAGSGTDFLDATANVAEATNLYLEETEGGYYIYFVNSEVNTYIALYLNSSNQVRFNLVTDTASASVWSFDDTLGTFVTNFNNDTYYMGTYNKFATFSPSKTSYISGNNSSNVGTTNFPARAVVIPADHECSYSEATCKVVSTCWTCGATTGELAAHTEGPAATCNDPQICTVCNVTLTAALGHNYVNGVCNRDGCGAEEPTTAPKAYYLQVEIDGNTYYFTTISSSKLQVTTDKSKAALVYLEEATGGYHLYYYYNGSSTPSYIEYKGSGTDVKYNSTPSGVWVTNDDYSLFQWGSTSGRFIGTQSGYQYMKAYAASNISATNYAVAKLVEAK